MSISDEFGDEPTVTLPAQPHDGAPTGVSLAGFGTTEPFEIGRRLRQLQSTGGELAIAGEDGPIGSRLLHVDLKGRRFFFRMPLSYSQAHHLRERACLHIEGSCGGARVIFEVGPPRTAHHENETVFESGFPGVLYYVQRRQHFRIRTDGVHPPFMLNGASGGEPFQYPVQDLSLGGIGLIAKDQRITWQSGQELEDVELELRGFGRFKADLIVVNTWVEKLPDGKRWYHAGLRFAGPLPNAQLVQLQRCISQVELQKKMQQG